VYGLKFITPSRQTLDSQAPAEDALGDLEGASAILGVEEGNGEDGA
jgi:hypothetical protein